METIPSLDNLQNWLNSFLNFERLPKKNIFWLDTMEFLCERFKNPQQAFSSVHVAGSKGKGSVCTLITAIMAQLPCSCGIYTSPHITYLAERICGADGFFPQHIYSAAQEELIAGITAIPPAELPGQREITWFELVTLYSFLCFRQAHVAWGIFETGLGGRLDATNVLSPQITVLTPIELEHTEYLGNTLEQIAYEKAGIIKKNTPVLCAAQPPEVRQVFRKAAHEKNAPIHFIDEIVTEIKHEIRRNGTHVYINAPCFSRPLSATLQLQGAVQAENAALAAVTVKTLYPHMQEQLIEQGLSQARLSGRFEVLPATENLPEMILDGAHTVKSIQYTLDTFDALYTNQAETQILFACAADKDIEHIIPLFRKYRHIITTRPGPDKQSDLAKVADTFKRYGISAEIQDSYEQAITDSISYAKQRNAVLLATGSFYLLAEIRKIIQERFN